MSMFGMIFVVFAAASILVFGPGVISAFVAWSKGYRPWFWLLSFGPVGTLLISLKPSLGKAATPEEREAWETRADWTGGILSGFTILPMFGLPLLLVVGMFSYLSMAAPAPPAVTAGPAPTRQVATEAMIEDSSEGFASDPSFPRRRESNEGGDIEVENLTHSQQKSTPKVSIEALPAEKPASESNDLPDPSDL
jgi:hypothetical protein